MSLTFSGEPGSGDPADWQMTAEWSARWDVISAKLIREAEVRGGGGQVDGLVLLLTPPEDGRGSAITVTILEPDGALVRVADTTFPANWYLTDTPEDPATLENIVMTIMDNDLMLSVRLELADTQAAVAGAGMRLTAWEHARP